MREYCINYVDEEVDWELVKPLKIDNYPWYNEGLVQETFVQVVINNGVLLLKVLAEDIHSRAYVLEENGSVYLDSCFEFFLTPINERSSNYINFEINCAGNLYLAVRNESGKKEQIQMI